MRSINPKSLKDSVSSLGLVFPTKLAHLNYTTQGCEKFYNLGNVTKQA